jgi:hypothetical protein
MAMDPATHIRSLVDEYELELHGVKFWAPYWVNNPKLMGDANATGIKGAFKGKGTPAQLQRSLQRVIDKNGGQPQSAVDYRQLMRAHGLGVDCSGFIYYVLSGWLRATRHQPLAQQLVVRRADILEALHNRPSWQRGGVSEAEVKAWPPLVSLRQVCQRFHKDPRMLTAVATLVHPEVVVPVTRAQDMQPGDMIKFTSQAWGDHIALIVEQKGAELVIAESTEPADKLGGVGYDRISIKNPERGLEHQGWARAKSYHPGGASRDGVWRLKELTQ